MHDNGQLVIALDKATGSEVWKVTRKSDGRAECLHSYASPTLWSNGKDAYLVVHGNDYTTAHDLKDGSEIWRLGDLNLKEKYNPTLRFVASPVVTADLIVVPSAKDGPVVAVKPDAKGLIHAGSSSEVWRKTHGTPDVPCPLVVDGLVYLCSEKGLLMCVDAKTGKEYYNERLQNDRHRASPVYVDGKILTTARDGTVCVVKAGKTFSLIAKNKLPDTITASPAISGGCIYLHCWNALYAIGEAK